MLERWMVKATDDFYGQLNRRISIPNSRQLIKLPITANMVSIFTLGVGIASAAFFAYGGFLRTLFCALFFLFPPPFGGWGCGGGRFLIIVPHFFLWPWGDCRRPVFLFF